MDILYEPEIADYKPRSRRAFEKSGFVVDRVIPLPEGMKAEVGYDMILTKNRYEDPMGASAS